MVSRISLQGCIIAAAAVLFTASTASGQAAGALDRGRSLASSGQHEQAMEVLQSVVDDPGTAAANRLEALEIMGGIRSTQGRRGDAETIYRTLLTFDPGYQLAHSAGNRSATRTFSRLRGGFTPEEEVEIMFRAPPRLPNASHVPVTARLSGPTGGVERVKLRIRTDNETRWQTFYMRPEGDRYVSNIPTPPQGRPLLYFVEVLAPSGHVLVEVGTADDPLRVEPVQPGAAPAPAPQPTPVPQPTPAPTPQPVPTPQPQPTEPPQPVLQPGQNEDGSWPEGWEDGTAMADPETGTGETETGPTTRRRFYRTWWFWTIVGAVVAGGTTAAVVLTLPEDEASPGSLGTLQLD